MTSAEVFKNSEWSTVGMLTIPEDTTSATVIIMLHAGASSKTGHRNSFVKLSRLAASKGIASFRFDLPGDGESSVFQPLSDPIRALDDLISQITSKYHFEKVFLVGHCVGALKSLEIAARYPKKISGVVLWHIAPILYAIDNVVNAPRLFLFRRVRGILSGLYGVRYSPKSINRAVTEFRQLTSSIILFPYRMLMYQRAKMAARKKATLLSNGFADKKVTVVLNPSKTHYKTETDGTAFLTEKMCKMGFSNLDFIWVSKKVFSLEWQEEALHHTIDTFSKIADRQPALKPNVISTI